MVRRVNGPQLWLVASVALACLALTLPAAAQSTGMVRGVVQDMQGQPVENAKVVIEADGSSRKFETKSNKKGEFIQIGLPSGRYNITAEKDKVASNVAQAAVTVSRPAEVKLVLGAAAAMGASKEIAAKNAELKKAFEEGVAASKAGNHDEAMAKFKAAAELNANCYDCYYNIAFSATQKKDYPAAEAAYKKAIELKPDYADAYSGLANVYNAQKKFDEAAAASAKALELSNTLPTAGAAGGAGGGNADALYNQGVILWNGGKVADAKKQFEAAIAANPSHAEAHYQLGMALVNEGNLPAAGEQFETYLKLSPSGPNAATAKGILATIKK
jgi:tetratricopeptide (TPR) repeat protein